MTVTLVDTRPSNETGSGVYNDSHVLTTRQPTPDLVPLSRETANAVASTTPSVSPEVQGTAGIPENGDVSAVVVKAKKAAQSLWVLIHAQNCRMGGDRCPHKGCVEAKRVLLHLKTCSASNNGCSCPTAFNGCHQSRKLLHHYLKCRELRAKQAGMGRRTKTVQHVCLVCSLVARHAKNVLEGSARKSSAKKQVISSFTLSEPGPDGNGRRDSAVAMPPPPPRQPGSVPIPGWRNPSNSDSSSDDGLRCESPPSRNQLMQLSEVAAAAAPPSLLLANPAALGKSLDSSKNPFLAFAASALQNLKRASPAEEVMPEGFASPRRSRAESYDERTLKQLQNTKRPNAQVDPTWELDLKDDRTIDAPEDEAVFVRRRARSASLGMLATACLSRNGCDTIEEEESLREEEPPFDIDEDSI